MVLRPAKSLLVAVFSVFCLISSAQEQEHPDGHIETEDHENIKKQETEKFNANEVIFGHVLDAHQFHFFSYKGSDGEQHHVGISLPVILYSPQKGLSAFSSGKFHHGEHEHNGYRLVTDHYKESLKEQGYSQDQLKGLYNETIIAVDENSLPSKDIKVYDFSLTRNVVQMILALALLVWILITVAR